jgi:DNA-binding transcriptional LysR family regulator
VRDVRSDAQEAERTGPASRPTLRSQDLVMLPVLRALLLERSVTRAGEAVGLSQPATSAALARLRRRFGDQLLVRVGRDYELSPFAAGLLTRLETANEALERLFGGEFDPVTTVREFTLTLSDYTVAILAEEVNRILAVEAPGGTMDLRPLTTTSAFDIDALLRQNDGVIVPRELVRGYPGLVLFQDRWVCIVAESNTAVGDELTLEHLATLPLITQYSRLDPMHYTPVRQLRSVGIEPHITMTADSFLTVPFLVAESNRFAFLQERIARRLAHAVPVRVLPSPIDVGRVTLALCWHPAVTDDPAHRWFRGLLSRAAQQVAQDLPNP